MLLAGFRGSLSRGGTRRRRSPLTLMPELLTWRGRGLPTLLDSSGDGLRQGVTAAPHIVKVNRAEAEVLMGRRAGDAGR